MESLREHYARTLRCWVANLEAGWDRAVELVGPARARIWRLYMAASAVNFEDNSHQIHQVLAVKPDKGRSGMPFRPAWEPLPDQAPTSSEMLSENSAGWRSGEQPARS